MKATWTKTREAEHLRRSSQIAATFNQWLMILGGELKPREPIGNTIEVVDIGITSQESNEDILFLALPNAPSPRVGSASTTLKDALYIFSGRGGQAMDALEENGSLWALEPGKNPQEIQWSQIPPTSASYPCGRSYHTLTNDGSRFIYLHAGCSAKGRLSDLWAFDIVRRKWGELAPAPDPPRGGTSIAHLDGLVYRMNGFDGQKEQGGAIDIYDRDTNSWSTERFEADGIHGPEPRSVSALLPVKIEGRDWLVTLFGERDPSSLGHQGAGKMLGDVWAWEVYGSEKRWTRVETQGERSLPRGCFAADVVGKGGKEAVVVHGGLGESNERLGDVWVLEFKGLA
ncbi:MAG: hypothetical protein M1820_006376 [Bogoriella megaspora]|nr:MAG: hypothetical protein M1820_006376 [Bogoriella megaspora]